MAWKSVKATKLHPREKAKLRLEAGEEDSDEEEEDTNNNTNGKSQNPQTNDGVITAVPKRKNRKKKPEPFVPYEKLSKDERVKRVASSLQLEEMTMEQQGRNTGIPKCSDFIEELGFINSGKYASRKKTQAVDVEDGGNSRNSHSRGIPKHNDTSKIEEMN